MDAIQLDQLKIDIANWLYSVPSLVDADYYIDHLEEADWLVIPEAGKSACFSVWGSVRKKFSELSITGFTELSFADQMYYVAMLTRYSTLSVFQNCKKQNPKISFPQSLPDLSSWATGILNRWNIAVSFMAYPRYRSLKIYSESMIHYCKDVGMATELSTELAEYTAQLADILSQGEVVPMPEINKNKLFLQKMQIFPDSYVENLLERDSIPDLLDLYSNLQTCLFVIVSYGVEKARQNEELFFESLRDYIDVEWAADIAGLIDLEVLAENESESDERKILDYLFEIFRPEYLLSGTFRDQLVGYRDKLISVDRAKFLGTVRQFLVSSQVVAALLDPLDSYSLVTKYLESISTVQANMLRGDIVSSYDDAKQPLVKAFLEALDSLYSKSDVI